MAGPPNIEQKRSLLELKKFDLDREKVAVRTNSVDFDLDVAAGRIPGYSVVRLRGRSTIVSSGQTADIWGIESDMNIPTGSTTFYLSSTNINDVGQIIVVQGLDENYDEQTSYGVLNGQNQVAVVGSWVSLHAAINTSATEHAGDIYIADQDTVTGGVPDTDTKIYGKIFAEHQNLMSCFYMVPRNHTFFYKSVIFSSQRAADVTGITKVKYPGGPWFTANLADVYQQVGTFDIVPIASFPEKSQIKGRVKALSNNVEVTFFIGGYLVHNDYL